MERAAKSLDFLAAAKFRDRMYEPAEASARRTGVGNSVHQPSAIQREREGEARHRISLIFYPRRPGHEGASHLFGVAEGEIFGRQKTVYGRKERGEELGGRGQMPHTSTKSFNPAYVSKIDPPIDSR